MEIRITTKIGTRVFAGQADGFVFNAFFSDGEAESLTLWESGRIVFDYRHRVKDARCTEEAVEAAREILKFLKKRIRDGITSWISTEDK